MTPEPDDKAMEENLPETEVSETRYMGEGPPGETTRKDQVEVSEAAYMGEPEERKEPKHETEYKRVSKEHIGKASLEPERQKEKYGKKPA